MDVPVSYYVYSSFSYFGSLRGHELPGLWFVRALREVGCEEPAVRQTLYRMVRSRELTSRREGREKLYSPSPYAHGEIAAGFEKIFRGPERWDGRWTVVHLQFDSDERLHRERLQELLEVEGFAPLASGVHLHPRPRGERILDAVEKSLRDRVLVLRGERLGQEPDARFIARHWDLPAIANRYRGTLAELDRISAETADDITDAEAFRRRFEVVIRFLEVAWDDPDLPGDLLPRDWPGTRARSMAATLYRRFLPGAIRFGDHVLTEVGHGSRTPAALEG